MFSYSLMCYKNEVCSSAQQYCSLMIAVADDLNTTELVLGTLATVTLRNKNATAAVQDAKCISAVFDTMRLHTGSGSIQRQCCMVIRNCAVSCTSFKVNHKASLAALKLIK